MLMSCWSYARMPRSAVKARALVRPGSVLERAYHACARVRALRGVWRGGAASLAELACSPCALCALLVRLAAAKCLGVTGDRDCTAVRASSLHSLMRPHQA